MSIYLCPRMILIVMLLSMFPMRILKHDRYNYYAPIYVAIDLCFRKNTIFIVMPLSMFPKICAPLKYDLYNNTRQTDILLTEKKSLQTYLL